MTPTEKNDKMAKLMGWHLNRTLDAHADYNTWYDSDNIVMFNAMDWHPNDNISQAMMCAEKVFVRGYNLAKDVSENETKYHCVGREKNDVYSAEGDILSEAIVNALCEVQHDNYT